MNRKCCGDGENSLVIDFLYVDLEECERCQSSDETLDKALRELREPLHQNDIVTITTNKTKITSDEQAEKYGLIRSPTLRINDSDIEEIVSGDYEVKGNYCPSCGDVTGPECEEITGGGNECRIFEYEGDTYETIPKEMIKEAIRKEVGLEKNITSTCCEPKTETSNCCETTESCC